MIDPQRGGDVPYSVKELLAELSRKMDSLNDTVRISYDRLDHRIAMLESAVPLREDQAKRQQFYETKLMELMEKLGEHRAVPGHEIGMKKMEELEQAVDKLSTQAEGFTQVGAYQKWIIGIGATTFLSILVQLLIGLGALKGPH